MRTLLHDLRFGLRMLAKNPGFTAVAVLTLALGIGANTAIFSVINTLILRSLPVQNPHELVQLSMNGGRNSNPTFSYPIYKKLQDGNQTLSGLFAAGEGTTRRRMTALDLGGTETEFIQTQEVTGNYFSILGVSAMIGRVLTDSDDREGSPQPVAVISHSFWQRRFGSDPSVVGKTITLNEIPLTLVGITPPNFFGIEVGSSPDLWLPLQMISQVDSDPAEQRLSQWSWWLRVMGRVSGGVDVGRVQAELDVIFQQHLAEKYATQKPKGNPQEPRPQERLELQPGHNGWTDLRQRFEQPLLILMGMVGAILLIACANVAGLLLARTASRQREFSVRSALGASRVRLIRQLLTESVLLSAWGGLLGILFAQWGTDLLLYYTQIQTDSISFNISPDTRVLIFTTGVSLLTGLLCGLAFAFRSSRLDLNSDLKGSAKGAGMSVSGQLFNRTLVVMQLALSLVLLIGAGLFVRTLENLKGLDAGFNRENVILFNLDFTKSEEKNSRISYYKKLLERLEPLPGVRAVSLSVIQPLSGAGWSEQLSAEGYAANSVEDLTCFGMEIGTHYFAAMGIPLMGGREFNSLDEFPRDSSIPNAVRAIVINESMARRYFKDQNPLGKYLYFADNPKNTYEIVGVVKDAKYYTLRESPRPTFYVPFFQEANDWGLTYAVRTVGDPRALMPVIQTLVREVDPTVQARNLRTMDDVVNKSLHQERLIVNLGSFFSAVALALACLGLYGVLSYAVAQRTREIGVRVALGARHIDVLSLIVGQGIKLALLGLSIGLLLAPIATQILANLLYGVTPTDPFTYAGVSLLLLSVAVLACYIPARRAAKVDPMEALRYE